MSFMDLDSQKFDDLDAVVPVSGEFRGKVCTIHGIDPFTDEPYRVYSNGQMVRYAESELEAAPLISKWEPGTRVRVIAHDGDVLHGKVGTVRKVNYASRSEATSVLLDDDVWGLGAYFYDDELEAE